MNTLTGLVVSTAARAEAARQKTAANAAIAHTDPLRFVRIRMFNALSLVVPVCVTSRTMVYRAGAAKGPGFFADYSTISPILCRKSPTA